MKRHMCLSIEGALRDVNAFIGFVEHNGKTLYDPEEIKMRLLEYQDKGNKVLPCDGCDNFDYETGCLGHE